MAHLVLPFAPSNGHSAQECLAQCSLYKLLPAPLQSACQGNAHLLEYLHLVPAQEGGFPAYHATLNKKLGDNPAPNLVYPVNQDTHIHIYSEPKKHDLYIPVEPGLTLDLKEKLLLI